MLNKIYKFIVQHLILNKLSKIILVLTVVVLPNIAYAQASESPIGQALSYIMNNFIYGTDGIIIATLSVGGCFAAAFFHKMQWTTFLMVLGAVGGFFGSSAIVSGIKALVAT